MAKQGSIFSANDLIQQGTELANRIAKGGDWLNDHIGNANEAALYAENEEVRNAIDLYNRLIADFENLMEIANQEVVDKLLQDFVDRYMSQQ